MVDFDRFRQTFFEECDDCLSALEIQLMDFQAGNATRDGIEEAFRAIHSIKGGAGAFGFQRIIAFSHEFEAVLDQVRDSRLDLDEDLNATMLRAFDILTDLISAEREGTEPAADVEASTLRELKGYAGQRGETGDEALRPEDRSDAGVEAASVRKDGEAMRYRILFRPSATMLQRGNEPILLFRELERLGDLSVEVDTSALPAFDSLDALTCYLGWSLELVAACDRDAVEEIFEFVDGDCDLEIIDCGPVGTPAEPAVRDEPDEEQGGDAPSQADAPGAMRNGGATYTSIRVDLERIDRMVNMVGEIVIAQAAILQQVDEPLNDSHPQLVENLQQFLRHTQNLQDSVMAIRAQPVKSIFDRMPRLVRELAQQTGKKVRLVTNGEDTEIDKTVIEKLSDPLTHMIRNAVDHGIEMPDVRSASGKPDTGTLTLSASQRGSHIVIELSDDGRGLDRNNIRRKAVERGLIAEDAELSEQEVDNLIFSAGFSTADEVSSISGRGVGMDVVNENIRKLGGRVAIRSKESAGSTVTLILPLTLAVMDGMVVRIGPTSFIIPLTSIIESLALHDRSTAFLPSHGEVLRFRDQYLKIYDLRELFAFARVDGGLTELLMVIETDNGGLIGLRVDEIVGQQQVVVKNLEDDFSASPCLAGGSIMGNGEVALILDPTGLSELEAARRQEDEDPEGGPGHNAEDVAA